MSSAQFRAAVFVLCFGFAILVTTACGGALNPTADVEPTDSPFPTAIPPTAQEPSATPTSEPETPTSEPTEAPVPITTFEDLAGTWLRSFKGYDYKLDVDKDGGAKVTVMFITPQEFWFEEQVLHVKASLDFPECPAGTEGTYTVEGVPGAYLIFTLVEDPCLSTRGFQGRWNEVSTQ